MNRDQAIAELNKLEASHAERVAELRRAIEAPEKLPGLWRPDPSKGGKDYWYVSTGGSVEVSRSPLGTDNFIGHGACFPSREIAEKAAPLMARANKIISAALQASGGEASFYVASRFQAVNPAASACVLVFDLRTREQAEEMARILEVEGVK